MMQCDITSLSWPSWGEWKFTPSLAILARGPTEVHKIANQLSWQTYGFFWEYDVLLLWHHRRKPNNGNRPKDTIKKSSAPNCAGFAWSRRTHLGISLINQFFRCLYGVPSATTPSYRTGCALDFFWGGGGGGGGWRQMSTTLLDIKPDAWPLVAFLRVDALHLLRPKGITGHSWSKKKVIVCFGHARGDIIKR